jgi:hypothetical protein
MTRRAVLTDIPISATGPGAWQFARVSEFGAFPPDHANGIPRHVEDSP